METIGDYKKRLKREHAERLKRQEQEQRAKLEQSGGLGYVQSMRANKHVLTQTRHQAVLDEQKRQILRERQQKVASVIALTPQQALQAAQATQPSPSQSTPSGQAASGTYSQLPPSAYNRDHDNHNDNHNPDQEPKGTGHLISGGGIVHIEYDLNSISSMPEKDGSGSFESVGCRLPPNALRMMQIICESADSPFTCRSDIMRAALYDFFNRNPNGIKLHHTKEYRSLMRLCDINKRQSSIRSMKAIIDQAYTWIADCLGMRYQDEAKKSIQELLIAVLDMEDGEWKEGMLEDIKVKWGHLIEGCLIAGRQIAVDANGNGGGNGNGAHIVNLDEDSVDDEEEQWEGDGDIDELDSDIMEFEGDEQ